jgi:serine phosphatase RsbU (regulator of sigma subunit)
MKNLTIVLVIQLLCSTIYGRNKANIDSLKHAIAVCKNDTVKINVLVSLSANYEFKESVFIINKALQLATAINYKKGLVLCYNALGDKYWFNSEYDKAQVNYFKAYKINDANNDQHAIAQSLYNIGWIYCVQQHDYTKAHYLYKAKSIFTLLKDTSGLIRIHNALGRFYFKADKAKWADSALYYYNTAIFYKENMPKNNLLCATYAYLFEVYYYKKDYTKAIAYSNKALATAKDSVDIIECLLNNSLCDIELGKAKQALITLDKLHGYALYHTNKYLTLKTTEALASAYYKLCNYQQSALYYKQSAVLNEEINRKAFSSDLTNLQEDYSLGKKEITIDALEQQNEIAQLKTKQQNYVLISIALISLLLLGFALFLYNQNKQKQRSNALLQKQNTIIELQHHEITSSIKYASGIQQALLTSNEYIATHLNKDYFILYAPKDIVSGDFYWAVAIHNKFYITVSDCTGHGVPGAFMSLLNISLLNENIIEQGIQSPDAIFNEQRKEIIKALNPNGNENIKDGMDGVLCAFDLQNNSVQFSASNNPVWLIRNNELIEYKADKMPVDMHDNFAQKPFTLHEIQLQKHDVLYMFTDGYADQFGGEKGKKFMYKPFKQLLLSTAHLPMVEQKQVLTTTFNNWKGNLEQVDDVCVMGIRI